MTCIFFLTNFFMKRVIHNFYIYSILKNLEINAFLHSDIYSFSLVMWEVLRKTRLDDDDPYSALEYSIPYSSYIDERDPDFEKMKKVVCEGKYRPEEFWRQYLAQDPMKPNSEVSKKIK